MNGARAGGRSTCRWVPPRLAALVRLVVVAALITPGFGQSFLHAQAAAGPGVVGVVRDESGAVLPGVTIRATPSGGGPAASAITAADGTYSIPLGAGLHAIVAELSGFAPFSSMVPVAAGTTATLDVTLKLAVYADTIIVTGSRS